jgi:DNA-binding beta-propeller fold protein YncE
VPVLVLAVVAAALLSGGDGGGATPSTATTATSGAGDDQGAAVAGRLARTIRVDGRPNGVVVAGGLVWVLRSHSTRLLTFRPKTGKRAPYRPKVGNLPAAAAALSGRLFVGNQGDATLTTIGLRSHKPIGSPLPLPVEGGYIVGVSAGERGVWVGVRKTPGIAIRVSPTQRRVVRPVTMPDGVQDLAVGAGAVWVIGRRSDTVTRVDVRTGDRRVINVGKDPAGIAVGAGAVWVTNNGDDTVTKIDQGSLVTRVIGVGDGPNRVATGGGAVWVANRNDSTLTRIDPETNRRVGDPVEVGSNPFGLDVSGHTVWVTSPPDGTVQRVEF